MIDKPSEYSFEDIEIGLKKNFSVNISELMLDNFAKLCGDYNPLHTDENYASKTPFKKRVCQGMLLASFFSRLVGMYLPGKRALYFSQSLNFKHPCFINDKISVGGKVLDKSIATRIITLKTSIYNQDRKCLVDGLAKVIVRK